MKKGAAVFLVTFAALVVCVLAIPSLVSSQTTGGGYPSRPRFAGVTVTGTGVSGDTFISQDGSTRTCHRFGDTGASVDYKYYRICVDDGSLTIALENDARNSQYSFLVLSRNGMTPSGANFFSTISQNGVGIPYISTARYSVSGSSCSYGGGAQISVSGCVRNGVGDYTFTLTIPSVSAPNCVVSPQASNFTANATSIGGTSGAWTFRVSTFTAGASSDGAGQVSFVCAGV